MKHVAIVALAALLTYCQTPPQPSAQLSPIMFPASPLASPAMEPRAILLNLMVADAPVEPGLVCALNANADEMARLLASAEWQERSTLACDYRLTFAAQWRAEDMAKHDYFGHDSSTGESANTVVKRFGCNTGYGNGNSVESIVAGSPDPKLSLAWLVQSPAHRRHIAGEGWFERQDRYGVGYAENPQVGFAHYWVILTAECE